jgi:YVTN family beta-propeller protein
MKLKWPAAVVCIAAALTACGNPEPVQTALKPPESAAPRIYVTNEVSGDMTVVDSATFEVVATVPLGKRPRGIHASPDRGTIYVALSGSPIAGPGVDEDSLPPPDKSADGIGVFDVAQNKVVRVMHGGSDPENARQMGRRGSFRLAERRRQIGLSTVSRRAEPARMGAWAPSPAVHGQRSGPIFQPPWCGNRQVQRFPFGIGSRTCLI